MSGALDHTCFLVLQVWKDDYGLVIANELGVNIKQTWSGH